MPLNPPTDFVDFIDSEISTLNAGTNLFAGPVIQPSGHVPKECVFVTSNPGMTPLRDQAFSSQLKRANVSLFVRSASYYSGFTLALDIHAATEGPGSTVSGYEDTFATISLPDFSQFTTSGLYVFISNFQMSYVE